jgi:putative hydrolase of the HAD superfamily
MLRAVTLDFWNTLVVDTGGDERERHRVLLLQRELDDLGLRRTEAHIRDAILTGFDEFDRVWLSEHRTLSAIENVDVILEHLEARPPLPVRERIVTFFERLLLEVPPDLVPGVSAVLPRLAQRYKLAVISDTGYTPGSVLREILQRHDVLQYFDFTYFSNEGGMSKPDRRVFLRVLAELDAAPREAAHVGDMQRTDIAGAQAAGMMAVHFLGVNANDAAESTGDAVIWRFDELPTALGNLMCPGC